MEEGKPWYHEYSPGPGKAPFDFQLGQQRRWPSPIFDDGPGSSIICHPVILRLKRKRLRP
jgi:hypothetical protein